METSSLRMDTEYSCKKENDKMKYRTLIETNIFENPNIEMKSYLKSFRYRTSLPEIKTQGSKGKKK